MADWTNPKLSSTYVNFLNEFNVKIVEAAQMYPTGTSIPNAAMRLERGSNVLQEWNGSAWVTKPIGVIGGGTGGSSGAEARTNLGFGSMSIQNANGVAITGGSITGTNLDATYLTAGIIPGERFPEPLPARNGGNLYNLNAAALALGQVPSADRLGTGGQGAGLRYLADNLTWKNISMAPRVARVTLSFAVGVNAALTVLPYTVQAEKTYVIASTGLLRNTDTAPRLSVAVDVYLSDGAGNPVTAGPATHLRGISPLADANSYAQSYKIQVVEWT